MISFGLYIHYARWVNWDKQCNIQWSCIRRYDDFDGAAVDSQNDKPKLELVCLDSNWLV